MASLSTFVTRLRKSLVTTFFRRLSRDLLLFEVQEVSKKSPRKERQRLKVEREIRRQVDVIRQESGVFTSSGRQPSEEHKQNEMNE